ncbi:Dimodular nonribosomal peptide synthase [Aliiroseovarius pelagivivens]|uniref:Dimodular nonribosomal peptide synthase n=2 Tax=Aliiroseovarius pelagivivens TaxID=1639690 RepID=A0A2R8AS83_9RHOB|nr:Dimodular nonribosomal peptide synthase [Aliiroseovarius pelagivivens]
MRMSEPDTTILASGTSEAIQEELLSVFRNAIGRPDFKADEGFLDAGGDSLTVIETILEIEQQYGVALSAAEFMALDTAENLARRIVSAMQENDAEAGIASASDVDDRTMLSVVQEGEDALPLVCAYGMNGEAAYAVTAAGFFPAKQPVAALQVRTDKVTSDKMRSFRDLAKCDAEKILQQYPDRRCVLLGHSLGAHVALAVGHELAQRGCPPALIVVLDDEADLDRRYFGALQGTPRTNGIRGTLKAALKCTPAQPIASRLVYVRSAENDALYRSSPTCGWDEIATGGVTCYDLPFHHFKINRKHSWCQIAPLLLDEINAPNPQAPMPDEAQILRYTARCAAREGDLSKEISLLTQAIGNDEDQPVWVYANLAEALFQKGDTAAALAALSQARRRETWQLSLDLRFLSEFQKPGREAEREDVLRRLAALKADHPSVHEQKARAYFRLGLDQECERELRAGLAMQPSHLQLSRLFARYLYRIAAWPELIATAEPLLEEYPVGALVLTPLITAYIKTGSPERALRFRDEIMAREEPDRDELVVLGRALFRCDRMSEALDAVDMALTVKASHPNTHSLRSKCLKSLGRHSEAAAARNVANSLRRKKTKARAAIVGPQRKKGYLASTIRRLLGT